MEEFRSEEQPQHIQIELRKYRSLEKILGDPRKTGRLVLLVFVLAMALFAGVALVIVSLKVFYPYYEIATNVMGATTIKNEDREISYWLFNTSELWADSGIRVKKGQTISVRTSGKKHSAIHHLVDDVKDNSARMREPWVGSAGFEDEFDKRSAKDRYRKRFRIAPGEPQDVLLMQIAKDRKSCSDRSDKIHVIGKHSENVHIEEDGTLFFAVNDIVLDDRTIIQMMLDIAGRKVQTRAALDYFVRTGDSLCRAMRNSVKGTHEYAVLNQDDSTKLHRWYGEFLGALGITDQSVIEGHLDKDKDDPLAFQPMAGSQKIIELFGYYLYGYKEAWFDDNVGSFLIIVESSNR